MFGFKRKEKDELDAALRAAGRRATALIVDQALHENHVFQATASHFGGNPYFEKGDHWPVNGDGHPYDFVCQINLGDCPDRPSLPFELVTVFYCWDLESEVEARVCIVRTYESPSVEKHVPIARPARRCDRDYKVRPCSIRTETITTYPWSMAKFPEIRAAAARFRNPEAAFAASLKRLRFLHDLSSRVGGYATWVHDNTLEHDDMILLAQIDYEPAANNCIGDAAPIYIAVSASNPSRIETDTFQSS